MRFVLLLLSISITTTASAQGYCARDGHRTAARLAVGTAAVAGNAALQVYFHNAWWAGEKADRFWVNNDWDMAFRDQDKLGHMWSGYQLARIGGDLLKAGCMSSGKARWWGAAYAAALQLQIEIWDGRQKKYGFSPPDLAFNTLGTALAVAQPRWEVLGAVKPTFSYQSTDAYRRGVNAELRPTVDYSGQTYWLSFDLDSLLPEPAAAVWPGVVRLSLGHSITDWVDPATGATQRARRRILLSLDLDVEKLPGDHPVWKRVKHELSFFRLPAPALQIYPTTRGLAWYR